MKRVSRQQFLEGGTLVIKNRKKTTITPHVYVVLSSLQSARMFRVSLLTGLQTCESGHAGAFKPLGISKPSLSTFKKNLPKVSVCSGRRT